MHADCAGLKLLDAKTIIVVAADQGLRRSVAFALEVEGYSTESYDTVQKAEASSGEALCTILDDEILKSET
ncbi:transcriptional regulator, partial [Sinorhizobium meliloti]